MASAFKWRLTDTLYSYLTDENGGQPQINSGYTSDVESVISQQVLTKFGSEQAYAAQFRIMTDMIASNTATAGVTLLNYSYYYDMNDNSCGFISGGVGYKGSQGQKGEKGDKGDRGNDGRGVSDVMFYPLPKNVGTRVTFYFTDGTSTSFDVMNGEVGGTMNIDYNYLLSGLTNMGLPEQIIHTIENDMYPELQDYFDNIFNGAMADINAMKRALSGVTHDIGSLHFYVDYLSGQTGTLAQYYDADHQALNTIDQLISALSGLVRTNLERVDGLNSAVTRVGQELNVMSGYIRNYVEEVKILNEATSSFTRDMSEIMQTARYIEQTVEHISGDIRDLSDQVQTASSVTTTISHKVSGLTTDMLRMQETYSSLTVDIQHISGDVTNATRMAQNASGLSINVARAVCGVTTDVSQLKVSYSSITADVSAISGDTVTATQIAQTANSTALYAFNAVCGVTRDVSQLKVSYSSITADVRAISGDVENATKVAQTASGVAINASRTVCGVTTDVAQLKVDYNNISLKVGESVKPNLIPDPIFVYGQEQFTTTGKSDNAPFTVTRYYNSQYSASPWVEDNGSAYGIGVGGTAGSSAYDAWLTPRSTPRIKLNAGEKYTFSVWVKLNVSGKLTDYLTGRIASIWMYDSSTGNGNTQTFEVSPSSTNKKGSAAGWEQYSVTFTCPSSYTYFTWQPRIGVLSGKVVFTIRYAGAKLESGEVATSMSYDYTDEAIASGQTVIRKQLLATGIDITNGKIVNTADQWECQNLNGEKTAWLDDFGNFTVAGVYNNLITTIDWDRNIGRELIITTYTTDEINYYFSRPSGGTWSWDSMAKMWTYSVNNVTYYVEWWIDALRCGNFINVVSWPRYGGVGHNVSYHLPYYATDGLQARGWTRFATGEIHRMSSNEMRQLVGKRITFKMDVSDSGAYYTHISPVFVLKPFLGRTNNGASVILEDVIRGLTYLGNSQNFYIEPTDANMTYIPSTPLVAHIECKSTVWSTDVSTVNYSGYGYVWCATEESSTGPNAEDSIDEWDSAENNEFIMHT